MLFLRGRSKLKLHVNYAWNMEPKSQHQESLKALEEILSNVGLHGGVICFSKDTKKSRKGQDNPNKIFMGGSKAYHLLSNHTESQSNTKFQIWKKICQVTTYKGNDAELGLKRARVWEAVDKLMMLLEKATLQDNEMDELKLAIKTFTRNMVDAWGETHITHYMVAYLVSYFHII